MSLMSLIRSVSMNDIYIINATPLSFLCLAFFIELCLNHFCSPGASDMWFTSSHLGEVTSVLDKRDLSPHYHKSDGSKTQAALIYDRLLLSVYWAADASGYLTMRLCSRYIRPFFIIFCNRLSPRASISDLHLNMHKGNCNYASMKFKLMSGPVQLPIKSIGWCWRHSASYRGVCFLAVPVGGSDTPW